MRRPRASRGEVYSVSCTDDKWERLEACARRRGASTSRYLVECALTREPLTDPPPRLILSEAQQRELYGRIASIAERTVGGTDSPEALMERLRRAVAFLLNATMLDMSRAGRAAEMRAILESLLGEHEASSIIDRFHERLRRKGLTA